MFALIPKEQFSHIASNRSQTILADFPSYFAQRVVQLLNRDLGRNFSRDDIRDSQAIFLRRKLLKCFINATSICGKTGLVRIILSFRQLPIYSQPCTIDNPWHVVAVEPQKKSANNRPWMECRLILLCIFCVFLLR